jgi:outer membrane protein OmpA-like peptidoglycan-associated protein
MSADRFPKAIIAGVAFAAVILFPALSLAQGEPDAQTDAPKLAASGCADLSVLSRLPNSVIVSCEKADSVDVTMPLKPDDQGNAQEKSVRGTYEFREYQILDDDEQEHAFDHLTQLLGIAGFTVRYSSSPSTITAQNQDTWILVEVNGESYDVRVVQMKEDPWTPVKNAQDISREIEAHHRVAIYGIEFSPDNRTILAENSKILGQVLAYLQENSGGAFDVESHTMNANGNADEDFEITRQRAQAVVGWLEAHGVAPGRLEPKALGRNKPIADNGTPLGLKRNDRIELAKTTP